MRHHPGLRTVTLGEEIPRPDRLAWRLHFFRRVVLRDTEKGRKPYRRFGKEEPAWAGKFAMPHTLDSYATPWTYPSSSQRTDWSDTHWKSIGYLLWLFGFTGAHRFYYGKQITGTIWFLTLGLLGIGWLVDFFLIPGMDREADLKFYPGPWDYNIAWALLTFLGVFGVHRFYMGKWISGLVYLLTGGLFFIGWLYDLWTLNGQLSRKNLEW